ncbi:LPS export ABC transporter periplasmic protein LptC [Desulfovibrio aminophilus]|uniref:LPS export ABC transporter periplasmic protein LptC n=1 Tax=Desulfovibrio aminophilus TaxID=81425 RepID=UPI00339A1F18
MRLTGKAWAAVAAIFVGGVLLGTLLSREDHDRDAVKGAAKSAAKAVEQGLASGALGGADISAQDIELVQGKAGQVQWRLKARSAQYSQEKGRVVVVKPQMLSYVGEERREVYVQAERGEIDQQGDNLTLWDRVEGRYGLFALTADNFDYIGAMNKVFLKGSVQVRRPDMSIDAAAVEIDLASRELVAAGGVTAFIASRDVNLDLLPPADQSKPQGTTP